MTEDFLLNKKKHDKTIISVVLLIALLAVSTIFTAYYWNSLSPSERLGGLISISSLFVTTIYAAFLYIQLVDSKEQRTISKEQLKIANEEKEILKKQVDLSQFPVLIFHENVSINVDYRGKLIKIFCNIKNVGNSVALDPKIYFKVTCDEYNIKNELLYENNMIPIGLSDISEVFFEKHATFIDEYLKFNEDLKSNNLPKIQLRFDIYIKWKNLFKISYVTHYVFNSSLPSIYCASDSSGLICCSSDLEIESTEVSIES
jgi:hypothetical protein